MNHLYRGILSIAITMTLVAKQPPLTDPILKEIDGVSLMFDKTNVRKTLWLIKEIKNIHNGYIKVNKKGEPDPRHGIATHLTFKGKKQTIKSLILLEKQKDTLELQDQQELAKLFIMVKMYFGIINEIIAADARGTQQVMIKLIQEFCRKNNRSDSLLLDWHKGAENELYSTSVKNFRIFYILSTDIMNFLAALIVSCPKATADFTKSQKKN